MKKQLLLLLTVCFTVTAATQNSIPNANFETWNSFTFDNPLYYPYTSSIETFSSTSHFNVEKTTEKFHGDYALKLTTFPKNLAYFFNCPVQDGDTAKWAGGMPYNQMPTGIRGHYEYNIDTADSALILVIFHKAKVTIGSYCFRIGGLKSTYTPFNFTFSPALTQTPDSVVFGATSTDFFKNGGDSSLGGVLFIDSVSFTGVTSQPAMMNGDFESWEQEQTPYTPDKWYSQGNQNTGASRTNDAHSGQYALQLTTYLGTDNNNNPQTQAAYIATGYNDNSCGCLKGGFPSTNKIDTLTFWYKYAASSNDNAGVDFQFKKAGKNLGSFGRALNACENYQYVEIPYEIAEVPDSANVQMQSSQGNNTDQSFVGSTLIIDQLQFKSQRITTDLAGINIQRNLGFYPNPTADVLYINAGE
ncbi:MAG TPA: hypothetical protein VIK29_00885, partial [Paludibacter sp.]